MWLSYMPQDQTPCPCVLHAQYVLLMYGRAVLLVKSSLIATVRRRLPSPLETLYLIPLCAGGGGDEWHSKVPTTTVL
mgnify:CR=1 FL=1